MVRAGDAIQESGAESNTDSVSGTGSKMSPPALSCIEKGAEEQSHFLG